MLLNPQQEQIFTDFFSSFILGSIKRYGHVRMYNLYVFNAPLLALDIDDYYFNNFDNETVFLSHLHEADNVELLAKKLRSFFIPLIHINMRINNVLEQRYYFFYINNHYFMFHLQELDQHKRELKMYLILQCGQTAKEDIEAQIVSLLHYINSI